MRNCIIILSIFFLSACGLTNPFKFGSSSGQTISQQPTKGGDATVKIYADRTEVSLNQPENTEDKSSIKLSGVPVVTGQDKDGKPIVERSEINVEVGGTTPLLFEKVKGFGGGTMASNIGYGTILIGIILFIASFVPACRLFIHSCMIGVYTIGGGFAIVMVDRFLAQYGNIACFIIVVIAVGYYAHRKGLIQETPEFLKKKPKKEDDSR